MREAAGKGASRLKYFLVDYENVQPKNLAVLQGQPVRLIVFMGANQNKVPLEFARALQALGENAEYVQISGSGSNALDFHIAYSLGIFSQEDPKGEFYIVSNDTGFDPLLKHLREKGIHAQRLKEIAAAPLLRAAGAAPEQEKLEAILRNLASRTTGKPRKVKTLSNTINALFLKKLSESEVQGLVLALERQGHISISGDNVNYH